MKKYLFITIYIAMISMHIQADNILIVGSEIFDPPFCFVDENDNSVGFSIDLNNAVLNVMNF
ncbi:MAG: transporter substrate-binding domain-containing protein [Spirochaetaceae bacterium]|jgi:ABC-type amino acid transport substrate-binding protein|nr:transporter substrate-binding domain-containing protein [Spirochaetaceae bacterium]